MSIAARCTCDKYLTFCDGNCKSPEVTPDMLDRLKSVIGEQPMKEERHMELTVQQKLQAMELRFYSGVNWNPKKGDYYTLTRASLGLEVFQIQDETDADFGIIKVWDTNGNHKIENPLTYFPKDTFTTEGFGLSRVHLPEFIYKPKEVACTECDWTGAYSECGIGKGEDHICPECQSYKLEDL